MVQREVEKAGIRTAAIAHLPRSAKKGRPPRVMHIKFPMGRAYGKAFDKETQSSILKDLLKFSLEGGEEEFATLNYQWSE